MRLHNSLAEFKGLVVGYEVIQYEVAGASSRFRARIDLTNGSRLFVREVVLEGRQIKYAFQWQDRAGRLLVRWDNAPHWPEVSTAPHHRHEGTEDGVLPSDATTLEEVLRNIRGRLG